MKAGEAKRPKKLEQGNGNAQPKAIVADQTVEVRALKEITHPKPVAQPAGAGRSRC
jgi:hypothetical protein